MHAQQVPASKPSPTPSNPLFSNSSQSPAALRGATSAFQPKPSIPTVSITTVSAGARLAALTAGTNAQQRVLHTSSERQNGQREPSPSRGRQLTSDAVPSSGVVRSTASSSTSTTTSRPLPLTRSSSTLAARHASAHSRSPQRSPHRGPQSSTTSMKPIKEGEQARSDNNALSGATASMTASLAREKAENDTFQSVKARALNFERIPALPAPGSMSTSPGPAKAKSTIPHGRGNQASFTNDQSLLPPNLDHERTRAHSTSRVQSPPAQISRQSSEESGVTISTMTPVSMKSIEHLLKDRRPRIPERGVSARFLETRSPPQAKLKAQDEYLNAMTVNDLANAMVASSLASSRATSPSKRPPPPPSSRRRSRSFPALYERKLMVDRGDTSKQRKPPRPMKHTLRKTTSSDDEKVELTKRGRRHWMRKHPNMHAEGDRKRWRDKVTEAERRRYEGLFAANRGLLTGKSDVESGSNALFDNTAAENLVVNVVVRDIWERSRLPREVLEEIYDLVCPEEGHALNREQFVVGLWLIDQRLKGRKLPIKVSPSVWASVRHSHGIKIRQQLL